MIFFHYLCFLTFKFKWYVNYIQLHCITDSLTIYKPFPVSLMLPSYVLIMLTRVLLLPVKELLVTFLVRQVAW